jgi:hypothetical protein
MKKQTIKKLPKLHMACGRDELRPVMDYIKFTKEHVVATDSYILAILDTKSVFGEEFVKCMPDEFYLHKNQWAEMCKRCTGITFEDDAICMHYAGGGYVIKHAIIKELNGKFPSYTKVLPKEEDIKAIKEISIDAKYIDRLVHAINSPDTYRRRMHLKFTGINNAVMVQIRGNTIESRGIIMPVKLDVEDWKWKN